MATNLVEVVANNSPYQGRNIVVYTADTIQTLISAYALAFAHDALRENQRHIGKRCTILLTSLARAALDAAIREACGLPIHIQQTAQQHYLDAVKLVCEAGLVCSVEKDKIATKKDICQFLGIPLGTLNGFLRKHRDDIIPIQLDRQTIRSLGFKSANWTESEQCWQKSTSLPSLSPSLAVLLNRFLGRDDLLFDGLIL